MTILVVDNQISNRELIQSYLLDGGYESIIFASNVQDAMNILIFPKNCQTDEKIDLDLIMLDYFMSEMNGIDLCKKIREYQHLKDLPVIMITSETSTELLQKAFKAGVTDFITKPAKKIELIARTQSAIRLKKESDARKAKEKELLIINQQLVATQKKLESLARKDYLTGLNNRRAFNETITKEWLKTKREKHCITLIMADIDYFKTYNDKYGHQSGDKILTMVAESICSTLKRPTDTVFRYGGEEFSVILPNTSLEGGLFVAENIRQNIKNLKIVLDENTGSYLTLSLGVSAMLPQEMECTFETLIEYADKALYQAKVSGRNRVEHSNLTVF